MFSAGTTSNARLRYFDFIGGELENELHDGYTPLPFRGTSLRLIGRRRTFDVACVPEWSFCVTQMEILRLTVGMLHFASWSIS